MKKLKKNYQLILFCIFLLSYGAFAQVGINTTSPNAQLDIRSSNQATPANTDGVLIPKVDAFPVTNPTIAQQGMLVYLTTTVGANAPGFYYWNNPTTAWVALAGAGSGGTLDQAYDFGGAGLGKTITADAGAVNIAGTDGFQSTGTSGIGAIIGLAGAGIKMFWNPRKATFRAGRVTGSDWDDANVGFNSIAFGENTRANGVNSTAFGVSTIASGQYSFASGVSSTASGTGSTVFGTANTASSNVTTAFGVSNTASGMFSTAFGVSNTASGMNSIALGTLNNSPSYSETVLGVGATNYTPAVNGDTEFIAADRLLVVGNAFDTDSSGVIDAAERSDALIILKNGLTRLPSTTNAMITAADGKAVVTKEYVASLSSGWSLTGNAGTSAATNFLGTTDAVDVIFKRNNIRSGRIGEFNTSFGYRALESHTTNTSNVAIGSFALQTSVGTFDTTAIGYNVLNVNTSGNSNTGIGSNVLVTNTTGSRNTSIGRISMFSNTTGNNNTAIGNSSLYSNTTGLRNTTSGQSALYTNSTGGDNSSIGNESLYSNNTGSRNAAFGAESLRNLTGASNNNVALGYQALLSSTSGTNNIGIGYLANVPTITGSNQLSIGNSIYGLDMGLTTSKIGIGQTTPTEKLHIEGNLRLSGAIMPNNLPGTAGQVLTSAGAGLPPTWAAAGGGSGWSLTGNAGTSAATNFLGTTDDVSVVFKRNNLKAGYLGYSDGITSFGTNALPNSIGQNNTSFGSFALYSVNSATTSSNTAIGQGSLAVLATGVQNTSVGSSSLYTISNGSYNTSQGSFSIFRLGSGNNNNAFGGGTLFWLTSGNGNTTFGGNSTFNLTSGNNNSSIGFQSLNNLTSGDNNIGIGYNATVTSAIGSNQLSIGNSIYGLDMGLATSKIGIGQATPTEKLHVEGNIRLSGALMPNNLPGTAGQVLTSAGAGIAPTWTTPSGGGGGGTLDQAYDFGGAGLGRTITADAGAVNIAGTDGFQSTGTFNSGAALTLSGAGTRMFWNPRKAAFRGGRVSGTQWDDANIGTTSFAFGQDAIASGLNAISLGAGTNASHLYSIAIGSFTTSNGGNSIAIGTNSTATGDNAYAGGFSNTSISFGETVLGIGATEYTPTTDGEYSFDSSHTTDRLLVVGNAIDADGDNAVQSVERSNALTILKNGNVALGNINPLGQFQLSLDQGRKPGTNTWTVVSDGRLKTINGKYTKGLSEIVKLNPVLYNYKNGNRTFEKEVLNTEFSGFIAQEVQTIFPEAVGTDADGFLNFNMHPVLVAQVNAIKELNEENKKLKSELDLLNKKTSELERLVKEMINNKK